MRTRQRSPSSIAGKGDVSREPLEEANGPPNQTSGDSNDEANSKIPTSSAPRQFCTNAHRLSVSSILTLCRKQIVQKHILIILENEKNQLMHRNPQDSRQQLTKNAENTRFYLQSCMIVSHSQNCCQTDNTNLKGKMAWGVAFGWVVISHASAQSVGQNRAYQSITL
mmetsp:Transcript_10222/g.22093  ORF Transcript_10222/g.22093 Transcript_10222/m.22093 type:complete len:167 (-) Transcript_10222:821-1321(-)